MKGLENDLRGQLDSLMRAHQMFTTLGTEPVLECALALHLGIAMQRMGDVSGSVGALQHAEALAKQGPAPELAAHAVLGRMFAELARTNRAAARACGEEARQLATASGDVELVARIDAVLAEIGRGEVPESMMEPIRLELLGM
jgi:hypothetical protein